MIAHYLHFAYPEYQQHKWTSFPHSLLYISRQANVLNCIFIQANRGCARLLNMGRKMLSPSFVPTRCLSRPSCQDTHASSTSKSAGEVQMLSGGSCTSHCAEQPEMSCAWERGRRWLVLHFGSCFSSFSLPFLVLSPSLILSHLQLLVTVLAFYESYFSADSFLSLEH